MSDLKARLLKPRINEDTVDIEGVGTVRVRGLSRGEVFALRKAKEAGRLKDEAAWDRRLVSLAMVDPEMTEDEVGEWQDNSPAGELEDVTKKIQELSGMAEGADKSSVEDVRGEPGDGVRVLPRTEAVDDGGDVEGAAV